MQRILEFNRICTTFDESNAFILDLDIVEFGGANDFCPEILIVMAYEESQDPHKFQYTP
jgi:hypothetical protein